MITIVSYSVNADQIEELTELGNHAIKISSEGVKTAATKVSRAEPICLAAPFFKIPNIQKTMAAETSAFIVIPDRPKPFTSGVDDKTTFVSMGPNILLKQFDDKAFGVDRINLFQGNIAKVKNMLCKLISFRNNNERKILTMIVEGMQQDQSKSGKNLLPASVLSLFTLCMEAPNLYACGCELRTFCQTWECGTNKVNFSVATPHFQTRVYVKSGLKLKAFLESLSSPHCKKLIKEHSIMSMFMDYTMTSTKLTQGFMNSGYEKKFVDLDALYISPAMRNRHPVN